MNMLTILLDAAEAQPQRGGSMASTLIFMLLLIVVFWLFFIRPQSKKAKEEHDFGSLLQGEVVSYSFHFTNTGNAPLIISQVTSSCGCTVANYSRDPIAPGKKGVIQATYNSAGHHGFQNRFLTVMSNTMPAKHILRIKGKVLTPDQY